MVHFSGFARKMNHLSSFCASEASAKMPFNAYFEFMYGFKFSKHNKFGCSTILLERFSANTFLLASLSEKEERWFIFRAKPEK
ncbi:MAG: hypothetical protein U5L45_08780 [Saprospiraceae bacterium]|nr:hypothetical protein [Saprospiraceae bacterium]